MKAKIICWLLALVGVIPVVSVQADNVWQQQLEAIKENTIATDKYPKLISYSNIGEIRNENDLKELKNILLSDDTYFPVEKDGRYILLNIKEIRRSDGDENVQMAIKNLSSYFDKVVCIGLSTVELEWECSNKIYKNICVVSAEKGIIYDSIILNIFVKTDDF